MTARWQKAMASCLIAVAGCASPQVASPAPRVVDAPADPSTPKIVTVGQLNSVKYYGPWDFGNPGGGGASLTEIHSAGLVTEDAHGRIIPRLATKLPSVDEGTLTVRPDGRMRATWQIRPDALWHDGVPLQAEDLAFSWQVHTHPDLLAGTGQDLRWIESAEAPDASTLVLTWKSTYYRAMSLGHRELWPLPKRILGDAFTSFQGREAFLANPYFSTEYVHLGPFRLVDFGQGETQIFDRFDGFFLGRPKLTRVVLRTIPDPNAVYANVLAGALDILSERTLTAELFVQLRDQWKQTGEGSVVQRQDNWRFIVVQFDPQWSRPIELSRDVRIRRGLARGIDTVPIRGVLYPGFADTEGDTFMLKSDPRAPAVGKPFARYSYDPQAALQEFAEAGWKRGGEGRMINAVGEPARVELRGGPVEGTEVALMADSWRQLGIDAAEEIASATLARDNEYQATFPSLALRAYRSSAELFPVFDSRAQSTAQNRWQGLNYSHYVNPALDRLTDTLYATTDEREQGQLLKELGEILATDLPALPAYFRVLMAAVTRDVSALVDDYAGGTGPGSGPGLLSRNAYLWDRR